MSRKIFNFRRSVTVLSGAALLSLLTGCVGDVPRRGGWVAAPQNKRILHVLGLPAVNRPIPTTRVVKVLPVPVSVPKAKPTSVRSPAKHH